MSRVVQRRRGNSIEHASFTGALAEITVDITKKTLVVHDGSTVGGHPLAREDLTNTNVSALPVITGINTAADDIFLVFDTSTSLMKRITRAELNNAIEKDALDTVNITGGTINGTTIISRINTIATGASVTIAGDTTDLAIHINTQAAGTLTINAPTGTPFDGQKIMIRLVTTNVQTFSWNAIFAGSNDILLPVVSTGSGKYDYIGFIYNSAATKWQILAKNFGF